MPCNTPEGEHVPEESLVVLTGVGTVVLSEDPVLHCPLTQTNDPSQSLSVLHGSPAQCPGHEQVARCRIMCD